MSFGSGAWIIAPFNKVFCVTFAAFIILLIVASLALRKKTEKTRCAVLVGACLLTLAGFFVYKIFLSMDSEFDVLTASMGGFNWWGELPLQLCNINMILIPIAVRSRSRGLMSFSFFLGPLGAMMALAMPGTGFSGYSLLLPRMLGYYGTHFMVVIEGLALVTFGLYRPRFKDFPGTLLAILVISLLIFGFNMLLRYTGLHPKANYFFNVETEGNAILDLFYRWLPYPYLYEVPCVGILLPYMAVVTTFFELAEKRKPVKLKM